jgi:hypothetical protein
MRDRRKIRIHQRIAAVEGAVHMPTQQSRLARVVQQVTDNEQLVWRETAENVTSERRVADGRKLKADRILMRNTVCQKLAILQWSAVQSL